MIITELKVRLLILMKDSEHQDLLTDCQTVIKDEQCEQNRMKK